MRNGARIESSGAHNRDKLAASRTNAPLFDTARLTRAMKDMGFIARGADPHDPHR